MTFNKIDIRLINKSDFNDKIKFKQSWFCWSNLIKLYFKFCLMWFNFAFFVIHKD